jgi:hypothetical protein
MLHHQYHNKYDIQWDEPTLLVGEVVWHWAKWSGKVQWCIKSTRSSTHCLNNTRKCDVSCKGPLSGISVDFLTKGLCSKHWILLYCLRAQCHFIISS